MRGGPVIALAERFTATRPTSPLMWTPRWSKSLPSPLAMFMMAALGEVRCPMLPARPSLTALYRGQAFGSAVRARGGTPRVALIAMWGRPGDDTLQKLKQWNRSVQRIRCRIEKIFGVWKRSYGLRRLRWRGLARAALQVRLTAIAYNLRRSLSLQAPRSA